MARPPGTSATSTQFVPLPLWEDLRHAEGEGSGVVIEGNTLFIIESLVLVL